MTHTQFKEISTVEADEVAGKIVPNKRRIPYRKVIELVGSAYYSGCLNTFSKIQRDPSIIRRKIGFIQ